MLATARNFSKTTVLHSSKIHTKSTPDDKSRSSIKDRIDNHAIHKFGHPKQGATHGYEPHYVMVRTLQRYPNAIVREKLQLLHERMAEHFLSMSDEALDWLLGGARQTSLGGFNTPSEFRDFLKITDINTYTSAQLIAQLEPILTSIGYRARNVSVGESSIVPETDAQKEMYQVVCDITEGQIVRPISTVYKDKTTSWVSSITEETVLDDFIECEQDDELSDDEDNLFRGKPNRGIPNAYYLAIGDNGQATWMADARTDDIPIRRHVSGTGPICMAAVVGLLGHSAKGDCLPFNNEQEAWDLFTALFIPKYLRSDYHSIVETYIGINHFIAENASCDFPGSATESTVISPREARERAYDAMCRAACDEYQEFELTPSEAMEDYQSLLALQLQQNEVSTMEMEPEETAVFVTEDDNTTVKIHDKLMMDFQREITMQQIKVRSSTGQKE